MIPEGRNWLPEAQERGGRTAAAPGHGGPRQAQQAAAAAQLKHYTF